ncbi:SDR family NAD(P)-dependent oxidoreductase [Actinophytocola sp.]|uniref:SDR family NAD(P)-dependent oxidoreductase n=1 Tax=Actinophytocola sp. TaxID=1872138 RepID=UPI002D4D0DD8|nr:SDR family NAD(P)-dependent oxidoreductase [Actinophytocola sp.]HYQ66299.1 SDR family NAD(P)-dependent oxidoreductase [Actinophytocola sp.]
MGRTALVTGGVSGIGQACAEFLAGEGLTVVTADKAPGADLRLDVTDSAQVADAAARHEVDVLVNSAGVIGPNKAFTDVTDDEWATTFAVNVTGTFYMCRAFIPAMTRRGWGRVVNLASIAGKEGNPNLSAYSASKAAVLGLTKSLGKELATSGVLINAVAPAVIETPMASATAPAVRERLVSLIPMRRMGLAREVAELVGWLASERCSFSTGAVYDISGGRAVY